jgi:hypothetical protein
VSAALAQRVAGMLAAPVSAPVAEFAAHLASTATADAVLFYGSNLRTGSLEGVLDFYVLLPGPPETGIWPRVSYHEWPRDGVTLRAKVAAMTLTKFREAAAGQLLDTTIWARFTQPAALAWSRGEAAEGEVRAAVAAACATAARLAAVLGPVSGPAEAYWTALFRATYQAEFRVEAPGRERDILAVNAAHFAGLLPLALEAGGVAFDREDDAIIPCIAADQRHEVLRWWRRRRRFGKVLNVLRLFKAAATFDGAARYAAWKLERHTGVAVQITPWRERHPVLAAPAVLWQVWRQRN